MPKLKGLYLIGILLLGIFSSGRGICQVANDNIDGRILLRVNDKPAQSTTRSCTVEWACIDESLTGKCIEYHNDQWFQFTPAQSGQYFVNISKQDCRDIRGVQLVVIDGEPCQPKTYRTLSCTSLATQDNIYVSLDHLEANHAYLLNIDGYLNDFCRFQIQVSHQSKGFPAQSIGLKTAPDIQTDETGVQLTWTVTDEQAVKLRSYQLYRRFEKEKKSKWIQTVSHEKNTRGDSKLQYTAVDTVTTRGRYTYQIIGLNDSGSGGEGSAPSAQPNDSTTVWIAEKTVDFNPDVFRPADYLTLRLEYALNTPLTVLIFDASGERLLGKSNFIFIRKGRTWQYNIGHWRRKGIYRFKVKVTDTLRKKSKEYMFDTRNVK
ncbi:MAG: hypothetical protein V4714_04700 [Bacteroidota bacterium]